MFEKFVSPRVSILSICFLFFLILPFFFPEAGFSANLEPSSCDLPEEGALTHSIRVAVAKDKNQIELSLNSPYRLEMIQSRGVIEQGDKLPLTQVSSVPKGIQFGKRSIFLPAFRLLSFGASVKIGGRSYPGNIQIIKEKNGKLVAVEEAGLEDYLNGVLPHEMWAKWPLEALKAQAVVSRTYALFKELTKKNENYALSGDVLGQVYGGNSLSTRPTRMAVQLTEGEILTYRGKLFPAYFHSTCGGETTRADYVWPIKKHHSLTGVECPYCENSTHYRWESAVKAEDVKIALRKRGWMVGDVKKIIPQKIDESGRAREILVKHSLGDLILPANDFRLAVGGGNIKSLKDLRISESANQIIFKGLGWGHGAGLCQWGAKTMAAQGKGYKEILKFYYPDAKIIKLENKN